MGFKAKLPILIVLLSLFVSSAFSHRLLADDLVNPYDDPRTEIRHCRQRCQQRGRGFHQIRQCMERCESMSADDDEAVIVLVDQDFDQCRRRCQRQEGGRRCFERCEDRFGRQGRRQQGSRCEDEREVPFLRRDPEQQRYQQCKMRCQRHESGRQQRECRDRCDEQFEQQPRSWGCRRYDSDELNADRHDPQQRFRQCKMRCQRMESGHQLRQCQKDCKEQLEQETGRGSGADEEFVDRRDPEQVFRQCRRECSGGRCEQRCEEQMQCHQRCQSKFPYRGQEGKLGGCVQSCYEEEGEEEGGRGFMETMCRQKCRIQGGGYECQRRCQRQYGGGNAALASLLSIFA